MGYNSYIYIWRKLFYFIYIKIYSVNIYIVHEEKNRKKILNKLVFQLIKIKLQLKTNKTNHAENVFRMWYYVSLVCQVLFHEDQYHLSARGKILFLQLVFTTKFWAATCFTGSLESSWFPRTLVRDFKMFFLSWLFTHRFHLLNNLTLFGYRAKVHNWH